MKLQVGQKAPDFCLPAHVGGEVRLSSLRGKNVVIAFFPLAWTPIWTNQIPSYETEMESFTGLNTQVLGISIDHLPCLQAWTESLGGIHYPLLSDFWPHGAVANLYGVLRSQDGTAERAIFVIDKQGIIRYIDIHDMDDQPENEALRAVLRQIEGRSTPPTITEVSVVEEPAPDGIVLYCARWCRDCRKMKAWFEERNLAYVEVDIDVDMAARNKVRTWGNGFLITPVVSIDGEIVLDYDPVKVEEVLRRRAV